MITILKYIILLNQDVEFFSFFFIHVINVKYKIIKTISCLYNIIIEYYNLDFF